MDGIKFIVVFEEKKEKSIIGNDEVFFQLSNNNFVAQDLEKVLPEAVYTSKTIANEKEGEVAEEHLAIRYGNTVGLLVEAIKELEARVKELEGK